MKLSFHLYRSVLCLLASLGAAGILSADDTRELEKLIQSQAEAWNTADAEAWGAAFSEDSSFINILGMYYDGRYANQQRHHDLFATIFADSQITISTEEILFLTKDLAMADTIFVLTDYQRLPPGIPATREGQLETRMKYVARRDEAGEWKFIAAQNTAISPLAVRD